MDLPLSVIVVGFVGLFGYFGYFLVSCLVWQARHPGNDLPPNL